MGGLLQEFNINELILKLIPVPKEENKVVLISLFKKCSVWQRGNDQLDNLEQEDAGLNRKYESKRRKISKRRR